MATDKFNDAELYGSQISMIKGLTLLLQRIPRYTMSSGKIPWIMVKYSQSENVNKFSSYCNLRNLDFHNSSGSTCYYLFLFH